MHPVGYFCMNYAMMHGHTNIKIVNNNNNFRVFYSVHCSSVTTTSTNQCTLFYYIYNNITL